MMPDFSKMSPEEREEYFKWLVLIFVGFVYSFGISYVFITNPNQRFTDDMYPRVYASGQLLETGRSIYDIENALELTEITGWPIVDHLRYYYPAYLMIVTVPLALLPYETARLIWTMAGLWGLWLAMGILARYFAPHLSLNRLTVLLILITTAPPTLQHTLAAQFNAIGVLSLVLVFLALGKQHYFLSGLLAGGFLFKPQTMIFPLLVILFWSVFDKRRWPVGYGLAVIGLLFWGIAEIFEPNWVLNFLNALGAYSSVSPIADRLLGFPLVSGLLTLATIWFTWRYRNLSAHTLPFAILLAWAVSINALVVPLWGMLHIISMGPVAVIVMIGYIAVQQREQQIWWLIVLMFIAGLVTFIAPLLVVGATGLQITVSEWVYRVLMPLTFAIAAAGLMLSLRLEFDR